MEIPPNYGQTVAVGVKAGLDRWGDINNIDFKQTNSRINADIIIQQQIGDGRIYGNAEVACLFDAQQCTIQLFTDLNVRNEQTLVNARSIEWTIAHEFGHLIGLPHHIEPDHIMNTIHDTDVRGYWEARNINVPTMTEPTYDQRLLVNTHDDVGDGDVYGTVTGPDQVMDHPITTEFIAFMRTVLLNTPEADRSSLWIDVSGGIVRELLDIIFP